MAVQQCLDTISQLFNSVMTVQHVLDSVSLCKNVNIGCHDCAKIIRFNVITV